MFLAEGTNSKNEDPEARRSWPHPRNRKPVQGCIERGREAVGRVVKALIMLKPDKQFGFYSKMNWKVTKRFQER